jgi:glycosyltransferase involved in cell wall biosynthesis
MSDTAILHGNYFQRGGGERVADTLAETFDAPLYYGFGNTDATPDDGIERIKLFDPTPVGKKLARRVHQYRDFRFMWHGTHRPELHDYQTIIESGNEFGWYVPKEMRQSIVKYVHSPPRGPYDMHHQYGDSRMHRAYALAAKIFYQHTTSYVDVYVANSEVVANRCRKAWDVDPEVVYPPVEVANYGPQYTESQQPDTYLTFSRLFPHKRISQIVRAFEQLDAQLIVGGDGPQREHLESIAPANVDVRGYLDEAEKRRLLAECTALLFNAENEDFGIVPVEAFASGTPVIGINAGFTAHQIRDGQNGILYPEGTPEQIRAAVRRYEREGVAWDADRIATYAEQFSRERFDREMQEIVKKARQKVRIDADVSEPAVIE